MRIRSFGIKEFIIIALFFLPAAASGSPPLKYFRDGWTMQIDAAALESDMERLTDKVNKLKEYYQKSQESPAADDYKKLFFEAFPDSFSDFTLIYGYYKVIDGDYNTKANGPLYEISYDHLVEFFNRFECIDEAEYYTKLINVSIGGRWEADAVGAFHHGLQRRVIKRPKLTFDLLKPMTDDQIESFFFFLFHSIHPVWEEVPDELKGMYEYDKRVFSLMEKGLKNALKNSGH